MAAVLEGNSGSAAEGREQAGRETGVCQEGGVGPVPLHGELQ